MYPLPQHLTELSHTPKRPPWSPFAIILSSLSWQCLIFFLPSSFVPFQKCPINGIRQYTAFGVLLLSLSKMHLLGDPVPSHPTITLQCLGIVSSFFCPSLYYPIQTLISCSQCFLPLDPVCHDPLPAAQLVVRYHSHFMSFPCSNTFKSFPLLIGKISNSVWHSRPFKT